MIVAFRAEAQHRGRYGEQPVRWQDGARGKRERALGAPGPKNPKPVERHTVRRGVGELEREGRTRRRDFIESDPKLRRIRQVHHREFGLEPEVVESPDRLMHFCRQEIRAAEQSARSDDDLDRRRDSGAGGEGGGLGSQTALRQIAPMDLPTVEVEGGPVIVGGSELEAGIDPAGRHYKAGPKPGRLRDRRGQSAVGLKSASGRTLHLGPESRRVGGGRVIGPDELQTVGSRNETGAHREHRAQRLESLIAQAHAAAVEEHRGDPIVGGGSDLKFRGLGVEGAEIEFGTVAVGAGGHTGGSRVDRSEPHRAGIVGQPGRMPFDHQSRCGWGWRDRVSRRHDRVMRIAGAWREGFSGVGHPGGEERGNGHLGSRGRCSLAAEKRGTRGLPAGVAIVLLVPSDSGGGRCGGPLIPGLSRRDEHREASGGECREVGAAGGSPILGAGPPMAHGRGGGGFADLGEGGSMTIGRHGPLAFGAVGQLVHEPLVVVPQFQRLTRIGKSALEWPQSLGDAEGPQCSRVGSDHQKPAPGNHGAFREDMIDTPRYPPSGKVHPDGHLIVQLDPLERGLPVRRMVVDLVEHHRAVGPKLWAQPAGHGHPKPEQHSHEAGKTASKQRDVAARAGQRRCGSDVLRLRRGFPRRQGACTAAARWMAGHMATP